MNRLGLLPLLLASCLAAALARAQVPLVVYNDNLQNGFQDWSWSQVHNLSSTTTVHSGTYSIGMYATNWQAVSFEHTDLNMSPYANVIFWANGGPLGGQRLQVYAQYNNSLSNTTRYGLPALTANTWTQFTVPLSSFGAANLTNFSRLDIQLTASGTTNFFYLDDIQFNVKSSLPLGVNATTPVRAVDYRWFGVNVAAWDGNFDTPQSVSLLNEMGTRIVRLPGGSLSDEYHWMTDTSLTNTWTWVTSFANFTHVITNANVKAQAIITVNYGTGTTNEAAAWVRFANVTNHFGFKYWEIGNECYGTWETDSNNLPHDPYTYAVRATQYMTQMRAADATIKIGIPVSPVENTYSNNATHFAVNQRTGTTNYGWTPIVLATFKSLGILPDFLVHHVYPEYNSDNDTTLLQAASNWSGDATNLRQQINDYVGTAGTNIELLATENNSDAGNQGRQSTSLVNGIYYCDSLGELMKTEFNSFVWWDFRNGTDTAGDFNAALFGWRTYGDLGMVNNLSTRHPTFYAAKLMSYFARTNDVILRVTNSYMLVSAFAVRHASGAVSLLTLNKDRTNNFTGQIFVSGFLPGASGTIYSFGIPQDEATRTNASYSLQDLATNSFTGASTNFSYTFPPYSMTMLNLIPAVPSVTVLPGSAGQFVLQVQGQPNVRYVVQNSADFTNWTAVATNTLAGTTWNLTNNLASPWKFWRAVWLP